MAILEGKNMNRIQIILVTTLLGFLLTTSDSNLLAENNGEFRLWHDRTYDHRIHAKFDGFDLQRNSLRLVKEDGTMVSVNRSRLCVEETSFLEAFDFAVEASRQIDQSPYTQRHSTLERLRNRLIQNSISPSQAMQITASKSNGSRDIESINNRWVEIKGVPYQVVDMNSSENVVGVSSFTVLFKNSRPLSVTPGKINQLRVLPLNDYRIQPRRGKSRLNSFRLRAVPDQPIGSESKAWKSELVFDKEFNLFTDKMSRQGHRTWGFAESKWIESRTATLLASSKWNNKRGLLAYQNNELEKAVGYFSQAILETPDFVESYYNRALAYRDLGKSYPAIEDFTACISLLNRTQLETQSELHFTVSLCFEERSKLYLGVGNNTAAVKDAALARQTNRNPAREDELKTFEFETRETASLNESKLAQSKLEAARAARSGLHYSVALRHAQTARALANSGRFAEFDDLIYQCKKEYSVHLRNRAQALLNSSKFKEAYATSMHAERMNPVPQDSSFASLVSNCQEALRKHQIKIGSQLNDLANQSMRRGDYEAAIAYVKKAHDEFPDEDLKEESRLLEFRIYSSKAGKEYDRGEFQNALESAKLALGVNVTKPNRELAQIWLIKGNCESKTNDHANAIQSFTKTLDTGGNRPMVYYLRAISHENERNKAQAIQDMSTAIQLESSNSLFWAARAEMYISDYQPEKALVDLNNAISLSPQVARLHLLRGKTLLDLSRYSDATDSASTALQLEPDSQEAKSFLHSIESRRRYTDPYYFDAERVHSAVFTLAVAAFADAAIDALEYRANQEYDVFTLGVALFAKSGFRQLSKPQMVNSAIREVFPNLPAFESQVLSTITLQIMNDLQDGGEVTIGSFSLGIVDTITRDKIKEVVDANYPEYSDNVRVADFVFEFIQQFIVQQKKSAFYDF